MGYALLADLVVGVHFAFLLFVVAGALLVVRWPRVAWIHVPCVVWGAWIALTGGVCPLTPLEISLREQAGQAGYSGTFIGHYLLAVLYPEGLTRGVQTILGAGAIALNLGLYGWGWRKRRSAGAEREG